MKKTMKDRFLFRVWDKVRKAYDCSSYGENALTDSGEMLGIREETYNFTESITKWKDYKIIHNVLTAF